MEDDVESDEEVETLRQGLVAVKFSKDFKQHIRGPWARALIVKVYGKSVGFHFLQSKLLSLWKPAGRMDCVNLGNGFFLVRLSLKEDFENVLKKGPWFIGGHFLSLRPWEPDFRPTSANVSLVAVWVRLNELPIEYYNAKALQQIGSSIGNVLRVDTFTASETRGRFARVCIQIDVEKPLVTAILLGKAEQPVTYEGIQKLCFGCGRLGHRREACPYSIRPSSPIREAEIGMNGKDDEVTCKEREQCKTNVEVGPKLVQSDVPKDVQDTSYGPWVVVARKKNGTRAHSTGGAPVGQQIAQELKGNGKYEVDARGRADSDFGQLRESKRKLSPLRVVEKAQIINAIQSISKKPIGRAQPPLNQSVSPNEAVKADNGLNPEQFSSKPARHSSVKGKKALARLRDSQSQIKSGDGKVRAQNSSSVQLRYRPVQAPTPNKPSGGESSPCVDFNFQFGNASWEKGGYQFEGCSRGGSGKNGDPSNSKPHHGVSQHQHEESMEVQDSGDGDGYEGKMASLINHSSGECEKAAVGSVGGCVDTNGGADFCEGKGSTYIIGDEPKDRMEFEGGDGADVSC